jgi:alpha-tubulin suppressor-like RCC1 family protein
VLRQFALLGVLCVGCDSAPPRVPGASAATGRPGLEPAVSAAATASETDALAPSRLGELPPVSTLVAVTHDDNWSGCVVYSGGQVACWGVTPQGISPEPMLMKGMVNAKSVAFTVQGLYVLDRAGKLSLWRRADVGTGAKAETVPVKQLANVKKVETSSERTCAMLDSGAVECWGIWGDPEPQAVSGLDDATDLALGRGHACAVKRGGKLACWGSNAAGQLGARPRGRHEQIESPKIVEGITDAVAVSAGVRHSCVLHETGRVSCWGAYRSLGVGEAPEDEEAVAGNRFVVPEVANASAITSAGLATTCALLPRGSARCWGEDDGTMLGDGSRDRRTAPVTVAGVKDIARIAPGTCAITSNGKLACWGVSVHPRPVAVKGITTKHLSAGGEHTCAIDQDANLVCWGSHRVEGEGKTVETPRYLPTRVGVTKASFVATALPGSRRFDGCVVSGGGKVDCWKDASVSKPGVDDAKRVALGQSHACALRVNGKVACWGSNNAQQLGGAGPDSEKAIDVPGVSDIVDLAAGGASTYALRKDGTVTTWGAPDSDRARASGPVPLSGLTGVAQVSVGFHSACARLRSGRVTCWSGTGKREEVAGISDAVDVSVGMFSSCAVRRSGTVTCWGRLEDATRGGAVMVAGRSAYDVLGLDDALTVHVGGSHRCATTKRGVAMCWGVNDVGQIGDGSGRGVVSFSPLPRP